MIDVKTTVINALTQVASHNWVLISALLGVRAVMFGFTCMRKSIYGSIKRPMTDRQVRTHLAKNGFNKNDWGDF